LIKPVEGLGGLPIVSILGFRGFSDGTGSFDRQASYELYNALTWIKRRHTVKMGVEFQRISDRNTQNTPPPRGQFNFDGRYSGHAFADYLLGALSATSRNTKNAIVEPVDSRWFGFVQDDWQLTSRLTVNVGLRYEYSAPFDYTQGDLSNWDPTLNKVVVIKGIANGDPRLQLPVIDGSTKGFTVGNYTYPDRNNVAPRLGLAWRPFGNRFVVRSSYGIFYNIIAAFNGTLGALTSNPPFRAQETFEPAPGTTPSLTWTNPFPGAGNLPTNPALTSIARDRVNPYMQQWNFTMEYEVARNTALRVSYLGNKGTKLERNANGAGSSTAAAAVSALGADHIYSIGTKLDTQPATTGRGAVLCVEFHRAGGVCVQPGADRVHLWGRHCQQSEFSLRPRESGWHPPPLAGDELRLRSAVRQRAALSLGRTRIGRQAGIWLAVVGHSHPGNGDALFGELHGDAARLAVQPGERREQL
jgi:hypothetical protein